MNSEKHLPEEIRNEYKMFVNRMNVVKPTANEGAIQATINTLNEDELSSAESDIITFYDSICRHQKPWNPFGS